MLVISSIIPALTGRPQTHRRDQRYASAAHPGQLTLSHGDRIIREHGAVVHITLTQPHALAILEVNCRNYEHVPSQPVNFSRVSLPCDFSLDEIALQKGCLVRAQHNL